jgi:hypothetical protein
VPAARNDIRLLGGLIPLINLLSTDRKDEVITFASSAVKNNDFEKGASPHVPSSSSTAVYAAVQVCTAAVRAVCGCWCGCSTRRPAHW